MALVLRFLDVSQTVMYTACSVPNPHWYHNNHGHAGPCLPTLSEVMVRMKVMGK